SRCNTWAATECGEANRAFYGYRGGGGRDNRSSSNAKKAERRRWEKMTTAPNPGPYARCALSPMRANPLMGATTQQSVAGRLRSFRKYSNTVGLSGGTGAKLLKVSYTPVTMLAVAT